MKKILLLWGILSMPFACCLAHIQPGDTTYSFAFRVGYAHNLTYGSFAPFELNAFLPINPHFEMQVDARLTTANTYAAGVQLRPLFPLPVGQIFLDGRLSSSFYCRDAINEAVASLSVGYRMQYVSLFVGVGNRIIIPQPYTFYSTSGMVSEPFIFVYRVAAYVRPLSSPWNIHAAAGNINDFQLERPWQPLFSLGGWYDVHPKCRLHLDARCKPTGMFHLNAAYYGCEILLGARYLL